MILSAENCGVRVVGVPKLRLGVIQGQARAHAMLRVFSLATSWKRRFSASAVGSPELDAQAGELLAGQQRLAEMLTPVSDSDHPPTLSAVADGGYGGSMIDRPDVIRAVAIVMVVINLVSFIGLWRSYLPRQDETIRGPLRFITNVNIAPASELSLLPGIGYELANRIVADRATAGPYRSIDDLLRVRGIGPKTIEQIKSMIIFDSGSPERTLAVVEGSATQ